MRFKVAPPSDLLTGTALLVVAVGMVFALAALVGDGGGVWAVGILAAAVLVPSAVFSPKEYELRRVDRPRAKQGDAYRERALPSTCAELVVHSRLGARLRFQLASAEVSRCPELVGRAGASPYMGLAGVAWTRTRRMIAVLATDPYRSLLLQSTRCPVVISPADTAAFQAELARVTAT